MNKFKKGSIALAVSLLAISSIAQAQTYVIMHPADSISTNSSSLNEAVANARSNSEVGDETGGGNEQEPEPELTTWDQFILDYSASVMMSGDFRSFTVSNNSEIISLPTESFPNHSPQTIRFMNLPNLTNISSLSSITNTNGLIMMLNISNTGLTNVDGLSGLTNANSIHLFDNNLTNVNGLSNLHTARDIILNGNAINNLTGLQNIQNLQELYIDDYRGSPLNPSSNLCQNILNGSTQLHGIWVGEICEESME